MITGETKPVNYFDLVQKKTPPQKNEHNADRSLTAWKFSKSRAKSCSGQYDVHGECKRRKATKKKTGKRT